MHCIEYESVHKINLFFFLSIKSSKNICQHKFGKFLLYRLTAFIVKVLTRSREYFGIQDSHISNSISYLVTQQQADGLFHDHHPVMDRKMQVGHP